MNIREILAEMRVRANNPAIDAHNDRQLQPFLQEALEAINRRLGYYTKDDPTGIKLVAGQAEYLLNPDVCRIIWLMWNGNLLGRSSQDELRNLNKRFWDTSNPQSNGPPDKYVLWGYRVIFYPIPTAAAIAGGGENVTVRAVMSPSDISQPTQKPQEIAQLPTQEQRLCATFAAASWLIATGKTPMDLERAKSLFDFFEREMMLVKAQYEGAREMGK